MSDLREQSPGGPTLGGYEILLRLKSGGMGEVLLARRIGAGGFEKLVALKTIRADLRGAEHLRTMFLDEAKLLARLSHPAIAQVYDFGEQGEELFLAMEYVEGIRFRAFAERRPPPGICARAMADVCRGLHAAHELTDLAGNPMGVVHRDVTPENLMLTFAGRVKILDFGIALMRGRQAPATELGTIKGKPPYLSPEQLKNEPVDRRTDIFSASIVLHELLTGQPLFVGDSVYAVARAIEHTDPRPPSAVTGRLPPGLDDAVLRGLSRDPASRYPTALALAEELDQIAAREGGESLEVYARRELAQEREAHRRQLQTLLARVGSAMSATDWRGRPSGVLTAQADAAELGAPAAGGASQPPSIGEEAAGLETTSSDTGRGGAPVGDAPELSTSDLVAAMKRQRSRLGWKLGVVAALLGAVGISIALLARGSPGPGEESEAGRPEAEVVAVAGAGADASVEVASSGAKAASADGGARAPDARAASGARATSKAAHVGKRRTSDAGAARQPESPVESPADDSAKANAFLTVAAEPFALVRIDGVEVGSTPIIKRRLAAGRHEVVLTSPDSGAVRLRRTVEIAAGEHEKVILR